MSTVAFAAPVADAASKLWYTAAENMTKMLEQRAAQQRQEAGEARANATEEAEILAAEEKEREAIGHHVWAIDKHLEAAMALTAVLEAETAASAEQNRSLEAQIKSASPSKPEVPTASAGGELADAKAAGSSPEGERTKSRTRLSKMSALSKIASPAKPRLSGEQGSPAAAV